MDSTSLTLTEKNISLKNDSHITGGLRAAFFLCLFSEIHISSEKIFLMKGVKIEYVN